MKNASAIERCINAWTGSEEVKRAARTELAGYTEIGPCGKHLKMFWIAEQCCRELGPPNAKLGPHERPAHDDGAPVLPFLCNSYCSPCREIEQAVEREVAGAYEAAALELERIGDDPTASDAYNLACKDNARVVRSLDSSAAARGKQAIREEALLVADARIATLTSLNIAQGDELRRLRSMPETAWLIERRDYGTEYLSGEAGGYFPTWTSDPLEAIRFSRRADAERIAGIFDDLDIHICDHEWGLIDKPGGR